MAIQHICNGKDVFAQLQDTASCYMVLPFAFVLRIYFEKTEAAYRCHRLGHRITVVHSVASHICVTICYFSSCTVMNYTENGTELYAHA